MQIFLIPQKRQQRDCHSLRFWDTVRKQKFTRKENCKILTIPVIDYGQQKLLSRELTTPAWLYHLLHEHSNLPLWIQVPPMSSCARGELWLATTGQLLLPVVPYPSKWDRVSSTEVLHREILHEAIYQIETQPRTGSRHKLRRKQERQNNFLAPAVSDPNFFKWIHREQIPIL